MNRLPFVLHRASLALHCTSIIVASPLLPKIDSFCRAVLRSDSVKRFQHFQAGGRQATREYANPIAARAAEENERQREAAAARRVQEEDRFVAAVVASVEGVPDAEEFIAAALSSDSVIMSQGDIERMEAARHAEKVRAAGVFEESVISVHC